MRPLHGEFVRRGDERQAGELGDLRRGRFGEAGRGIDPGADGGAAERQAVHAGQRSLDPLDVVGEHAGVAGPLLSQRERRRVLHVRAADLDDVLPCLGFRAMASRRAVIAGISRRFTSTAAAIFIADGNESFDDCDMFT